MVHDIGSQGNGETSKFAASLVGDLHKFTTPGPSDPSDPSSLMHFGIPTRPEGPKAVPAIGPVQHVFGQI